MARPATAVARRYGSDNDMPYYAVASPTLLAGIPSEITPAKADPAEEREWGVIFDHCESRRQALYNWRLPWWVTHGQIARYLRPERFYAFIVKNVIDQGLRRDQAIVDRWGTIVGDNCAAGLMAGLTDPDRPWLNLGPAIPGFEPDKQGSNWYEDLTERLRYVHTHSNFYDAQAQHYNDLVFFGTAPIIDYPDAGEIIRSRTPCAGEYMLGTGFDFSDEVLCEEFRLTISQMIEMFGPENCPADALRMWGEKGGALEYQEIIGHLIEPNFAIEDDIGIVPGGFTWREVFWVRGKKTAKPLSIAGFHEKPFDASRWNVQGNEAYGHGIGEYLLGDAIQLQFETRQLAESIEKVNRPPMGADVSLQNLPAATSPGKITYFNTANGEKKFFPLFEVHPDIAAIVQNLEGIRERMGKTAFNDVFQPMDDLRQETKTEITATEIDAIKEERLLPLGPVFGRIYGTLRTRVKRHVAIMQRRGLVPPKPASLQGVPTRIELVSMLTAAQKATATAAIARTAQFTAQIAPTWPVARFMLDPEMMIREFGSGVGATTKVFNSKQRVKQLIQAEEQQNQEAKLMAQTQAGAAAAASLGKAQVAPGSGSALAALVGAGNQ